MTPTPRSADDVWEHTLLKIRRTRTRRRAIRGAFAVLPVMGLAGFAWMSFKTAVPVEALVVPSPPPTSFVETIAVLKVAENGEVRLEEVGVDELGSIELAFGSTPLISEDSMGL